MGYQMFPKASNLTYGQKNIKKEMKGAGWRKQQPKQSKFWQTEFTNEDLFLPFYRKLYLRAEH